jgi:hypothetical protein
VAAKKPFSQRSKPTPVNMDDIFGNALGLDPELVASIKAKGLSHRFINARKLIDMGGYHPKGWRPYKPSAEERAKLEAQSLLFGSDPDGYIRRGDCILAVRTSELNDKHKAYLKQEAARTQNTAKNAASQIRDFIKSNGLDMRVQEGAEVHEGFGEDEDNE